MRIFATILGGVLVLAACQKVADGTFARYHHLQEDPIRVIMPPTAPYMSQQYRRLPPELAREREVRDHLAIDVQAPLGTPVLAVAPGRVTRVQTGPAYGKRVELTHAPDAQGKSIVTRYFHLDSQTVVEGQTVARGEQIGTLGHSGFLAGTLDHLHYSVIQAGRAEDPNRFWVEGIGRVTCFDPSASYNEQVFAATYPVGC